MKCSDCKYYQAGDPAQTGGVPWGYCFLKPPVVMMSAQAAPTQQRIAKAGQPQGMDMMMVPVSVRPQVRAVEFCGDHAPILTH